MHFTDGQQHMLYERSGMMEAVEQYLVMVIAASMICGLFSSFLSDDSIGKIMKLLCRIFLLISILGPITNKVIPEIKEWNPIAEFNAEAAIQSGQEYALQIEEEIIIQKSEAYILDKANSIGMSVSAEVGLGENMLPETVLISGNYSPQNKEILQNTIENDLGITKEQQKWIGVN